MVTTATCVSYANQQPAQAREMIPAVIARLAPEDHQGWQRRERPPIEYGCLGRGHVFTDQQESLLMYQREARLPVVALAVSAVEMLGNLQVQWSRLIDTRLSLSCLIYGLVLFPVPRAQFFYFFCTPCSQPFSSFRFIFCYIRARSTKCMEGSIWFCYQYATDGIGYNDEALVILMKHWLYWWSIGYNDEALGLCEHPTVTVVTYRQPTEQ